MKISIPPFTKGDKVAYVTGYKMPKGTIKIVEHVVQFPCGCWFIGFNDPYSDDGCMTSSCGDHNVRVPVLSYRHWVPSSWKLVDERPFPLMTFSKIKEEEKEEILIPN